MAYSEHAQLHSCSLFLWTIDPEGEALKATLQPSKLKKYLVDQDPYRRAATTYRGAATNIYRCSDGRYFQTHGSFNPSPILDLFGMPHDAEVSTASDAWTKFEEKTTQISSTDLLRGTVQAGQAGHICNTVDEYENSEQGKATSHVGLFEIHHVPSPEQKPNWWPEAAGTSALRPLAGLKVVDLTRVIAAPSITRGLAELGASVMRVTGPEVPDFTGLHIDLNWGKWNSYIDVKTESGRLRLRELIADADVVVNGYRPGTLDKYGFSQEDILSLVSSRDRGIIYVKENCYGWYGPDKMRIGWQPTSDACTGVSHGYGNALGLADDEPVVSLFPNSDYSTGLAGVSAILSALIQRAERGGSYVVELALNYFNRWLTQSCGQYPDHIWEPLWESYGKFQFRANNPMEVSGPFVLKLMSEKNDSFRDEYFITRRSGVLGVDIRCLKPALEFPDGEVNLSYNVGTRGNGVDKPFWPQDLLTEVVT